MTIKNLNIEKELGEKLLALYKRAPFGTVPKKEIDLLVFDALARALIENHKLSWWELDPKTIRQLSFDLKVTENKIELLIEQIALQQGVAEVDKNLLLEKIKELAIATQQDNKDILKGKIRLYVSNRLLRSAIENLLLSGGGIPETSFNKGQLVIRLGDLLVAYAGENERKFLETIADNARKYSNNDDLKQMIAVINKKTAREVAINLGTTLMERALGEGVSEGLGSIFKILFKAINE